MTKDYCEGDRSPAKRVSVLVPVKNGAATLAEALDSVLCDLEQVDEIIVIDDHSVDETLQIVQRFGGNVRVIHNEGVGIVDALNAGAANSEAEFVARCDADDRWLPGHLTALFKLQRLEPAAMAYFGAAVAVDDGGERVTDLRPPPSGDLARKALLRGNPFIHGTVLMRRDVLLGHGGYKSVAGAEDYDLWLRLSRTGRLATTDKPIYQYTISSGEAHARKRRLQAKSTVKLLLRELRLTRRVSLRGLMRNLLSAVWIWPRWWTQ